LARVPTLEPSSKNKRRKEGYKGNMIGKTERMRHMERQEERERADRAIERTETGERQKVRRTTRQRYMDRA